MSNFVYDNTNLNNAKVNRNPLPGGEDPNKWVQADEDWNPAMNAALDLRLGVLANRYMGFQQLSSDPPAPATPGTAADHLWLKSGGDFCLTFGGVASTILRGIDAIVEGLVNTTSPLDVIDVTPTAHGDYDVKIYYRVANAQTTVTIDMTWTDDGGVQTYNITPATPQPIGSYLVPIQYIRAKSTGPIKVTFTTDIANNVYVTSKVVRN